MESSHYPHPTSEAVTAVMKGNRKTDTRPEVALRSALHRSGMRFRKDHSLKVDADRAIRADIVFPTEKLAVFVDGCFWHKCPQHGTQPRSNRNYWTAKLARNVERDGEVNARLAEAGWEVLRLWEHESVAEACKRVARRLAHIRRRPGRAPGFVRDAESVGGWL
jgi:DNA mismatch endonuclease (patch repair protein)